MAVLRNTSMIPGEHRVKHCWNQPVAGFQRSGNAFIGKCPSTLPKSVAEALLQSGIPIHHHGDGFPAKIYNVHEGVIYEAAPTEPGRSYHGYPWRNLPGRNRIPKAILRELERRAERSGHHRQFRDWMARHGH